MQPSDSRTSYDISDPEGNAGKPLLGMQTWNATVKEVGEEWDSSTYDIKPLPTWAVFTYWKGSAWENAALWRSISGMLSISIVSAVVAYYLPTTRIMSSAMLMKLGTFLNVFIGFMIGMFMASSIYRWYDSTQAFMALLDAVRNMHIQLIALGVSTELKDTVTRYGLLSAWLLNLNLQMHCVAKAGSGEPDDTEEQVHTPRNIKKLWHELDKIRPNIVSPKERRMLMRYKEPYSLVWTWVASLVGRMAKDGDIPPMASPTYGRILDIIKSAYANIRKTRTPFLIKAPFVYIHTLSILVHLNNLINAMIFGILLGKMMPYFILTGTQLREARLLDVHAPNALVDVSIAFCLNLVAPALYLTLLDASTCMYQPFKFKDAKIPLLRCLTACEMDLRSADLIAEDPPLWEKPVFKAQK